MTPPSISHLLPAMAQAAQRIYDDWEQDETGHCDWLGSGGICQDIADGLIDPLLNAGIDATTVSAQVGEQHVWVVADLPEGVYSIDIPPGVYETGGGYNWRKIPGVRFGPSDIVVSYLDEPGTFEQYVEQTVLKHEQRVTLGAINRALQAAGIPGELVRAMEGSYFYMQDRPEEGNFWSAAREPSFYTMHLGGQSIEDWVNEIRGRYEAERERRGESSLDRDIDLMVEGIVSVKDYLQATIHEKFTVAADRLAQAGEISREERIELSGLIGDVLKDFDSDFPEEIAERQINVELELEEEGLKHESVKQALRNWYDRRGEFDVPDSALAREVLQGFDNAAEALDYIASFAPGDIVASTVQGFNVTPNDVRWALKLLPNYREGLKHEEIDVGNRVRHRMSGETGEVVAVEMPGAFRVDVKWDRGAEPRYRSGGEVTRVNAQDLEVESLDPVDLLLEGYQFDEIVSLLTVPLAGTGLEKLPGIAGGLFKKGGAAIKAADVKLKSLAKGVAKGAKKGAEFIKSCPKGQERNPTSGKCEPIKCPEGYFLDKETGSCVARTASEVDCPEGKFWDSEKQKCATPMMKIKGKLKPVKCKDGYQWEPKANACLPAYDALAALTKRREKRKALKGAEEPEALPAAKEPKEIEPKKEPKLLPAPKAKEPKAAKPEPEKKVAEPGAVPKPGQRCPRGYRKNPKSGVCEPREAASMFRDRGWQEWSLREPRFEREYGRMRDVLMSVPVGNADNLERVVYQLGGTFAYDLYHFVAHFPSEAQALDFVDTIGAGVVTGREVRVRLESFRKPRFEQAAFVTLVVSDPGMAVVLLDQAGISNVSTNGSVMVRRGDVDWALRQFQDAGIDVLDIEARRRFEQDEEKPELDIDAMAEKLGVDAGELAQGIEVEKEHSDTVGGDIKTIIAIAVDHLAEDPEYYTKLAEMEAGFEDGEEETPEEEPTQETEIPEEAEQAITALLSQNPEPDDKTIHALAEKLGMDPDELEEIVYAMLGQELAEEGFRHEQFMDTIHAESDARYYARNGLSASWIRDTLRRDYPGLSMAEAERIAAEAVRTSWN